MNYQFTVPNMAYLLTLKFADPTYATGGQRQFSINGNNVLIAPGIDVAASAGGQYKPWDLTVPLNISNGQLSLVFNPITNPGNNANPFVSAIELLPVGEVEITPSTAQLWPSRSRSSFPPGWQTRPTAGITWSASAGTITAARVIPRPRLSRYAANGDHHRHERLQPSRTKSETITLFPPTSVSVTPATATLHSGQTQPFTATVTNSGGMGVNWTVTPAGMGSITPAGIYTAPASIFTAQNVTITATSLADGHTGTAAIALAPTITVTVAPGGLTMGPNERAQFTAGVAGSWNTAVNWTASAGVITASGLYTAPSSIATATTATITATSAADGSTAGSVAVTLSPAQMSITVSVTPATASLVSGQTKRIRRRRRRDIEYRRHLDRGSADRHDRLHRPLHRAGRHLRANRYRSGRQRGFSG